MKEYTKVSAKAALTNLLNECLESMNQERSFEVKNIDLKKMKFTVEFNIVIVDDDDYIGFQGY